MASAGDVNADGYADAVTAYQYADGTFRWGNNITRGQVSKVVSNAANFQNSIPSTQQTFQDVPNTDPFWLFIERVAGQQIISGYTCGGPGEPYRVQPDRDQVRKLPDRDLPGVQPRRDPGGGRREQ